MDHNFDILLSNRGMSLARFLMKFSVFLAVPCSVNVSDLGDLLMEFQSYGGLMAECISFRFFSTA